MLELCRKKTLARSITAMAALFPGHYQFCPKTYVLPEDLQTLWKDFKSPKKGKPKTLILKPDSGSQVHAAMRTTTLKSCLGSQMHHVGAHHSGSTASQKTALVTGSVAILSLQDLVCTYAVMLHINIQFLCHFRKHLLCIQQSDLTCTTNLSQSCCSCNLHTVGLQHSDVCSCMLCVSCICWLYFCCRGKDSCYVTGQGYQVGAERIRLAAGLEGPGRSRHHCLKVPAQASTREWLQV